MDLLISLGFIDSIFTTFVPVTNSDSTSPMGELSRQDGKLWPEPAHFPHSHQPFGNINAFYLRVVIKITACQALEVH